MFRGSFSCYDMAMSIMPAAVLTGLSIVVNLGAAAINVFHYHEWDVLAISALQTVMNLYLTLFVLGAATTCDGVAQHPLRGVEEDRLCVHVPGVHAHVCADRGAVALRNARVDAHRPYPGRHGAADLRGGLPRRRVKTLERFFIRYTKMASSERISDDAVSYQEMKA